MFDISVLNKVYNKLEDEESRFWFNAKMHYFLTRDPYEFFNILCDYKKSAGFAGDDIERLSSPEYDGKRIIIFGAGKCGANTYYTIRNSELGSRLYAFADNDPAKVGTRYCGLDVISFSDVVRFHQDALVVISSVYHSEIYYQFIYNFFPQYNIFVPRYSYLSATLKNAWHYFDMFDPGEHEVFVDAGCYDGKSSIDFVRWSNGKYDKIYAFEPSGSMASCARELFKENGITSYEMIEKVCWSEKTQLRFSTSGGMGEGANVTASGGELVLADTIDNVLEGRPVTFIKMDIEGSELEALKGAAQSIRKYRPRLAISIYHKGEDMFEIPAYILSLMPDYKLYIRHYSSEHYDTVLYAV